MPIFWHAATRGDFAAIRHFYRDLDPATLTGFIAAIFQGVSHLEQHPNIGKPGRVGGTRELVIKGTRFVVAYTVASDRIIVLCVYHSARKWPEIWLRAHIGESLKQARAREFASDEEVRRAYDSFGESDPPKTSE